MDRPDGITSIRLTHDILYIQERLIRLGRVPNFRTQNSTQYCYRDSYMRRNEDPR